MPWYSHPSGEITKGSRGSWTSFAAGLKEWLLCEAFLLLRLESLVVWLLIFFISHEDKR
jgi:hypothetical protein